MMHQQMLTISLTNVTRGIEIDAYRPVNLIRILTTQNVVLEKQTGVRIVKSRARFRNGLRRSQTLGGSVSDA